MPRTIDCRDDVRRQDVGGEGVGLRCELARKSDLDAGVDLAFSPGTAAVYLVVATAWVWP